MAEIVHITLDPATWPDWLKEQTALVHEAAEAQERLGDDELERYAREREANS